MDCDNSEANQASPQCHKQIELALFLSELDLFTLGLESIWSLMRMDEVQLDQKKQDEDARDKAVLPT